MVIPILDLPASGAVPVEFTTKFLGDQPISSVVPGEFDFREPFG